VNPHGDSRWPAHYLSMVAIIAIVAIALILVNH